MTVQLPITKSKPTTQEPRKLFVYSHVKVGKTSNLATLPNSLIIDMEDSAEFYECASLNVKRIAKEEGKSKLAVLKEIRDQLEKSDHKYDYIILDTTTVLEEIASNYATTLYKRSQVGKNFEGSDVVSELPKGGGYKWLRKAFDEIYSKFEMLPAKCLILSGHVKLGSVEKEGKDISCRDIELTGKLKIAVSQDVDAVGYIYRKQDSNQNYISFQTTENDLFTGSRLPYLSGHEYLLSEKDENNVVHTYWDQIFPSMKEQKKSGKAA